MTFQITKLFN